MIPFLRWWIMFVCFTIIGFVFVYSGWAYRVWFGDVTKISFLIYGLFIYFSIRTGIDMHRIRIQHEGCSLFIDFKKRNDLSWFASDAFLTLGLIGTLFGLIFIAPIDITKSKADIIGALGTGWGTALYTTISGLVCRLLLRVQLYNLEQQCES